MSLLVIGIALWALAHLFKRLAPDARAKLGTPGRGIVAVLILFGLAFIILGYREPNPISSRQVLIYCCGFMKKTHALISKRAKGVKNTIGWVFSNYSNSVFHSFSSQRAATFFTFCCCMTNSTLAE